MTLATRWQKRKIVWVCDYFYDGKDRMFTVTATHNDEAFEQALKKLKLQYADVPAFQVRRIRLREVLFGHGL